MARRIDIGGNQGRHPDGIDVGRPSRWRDSLVCDCPPEEDVELPDDGTESWLGLLLAVVVVCLCAATVLVACDAGAGEIDCVRRVCT